MVEISASILDAKEDEAAKIFYNLEVAKIDYFHIDVMDGKFVEKNGGGMHHMAFAVEDVAEALNEAAAAGCQLIDKAPRAGAEGLQIGFLHPKSTNRVLTELCGKK